MLKANEHRFDASSQILDSASTPIDLEIPLIMSKLNLFKIKDITIGKIKRMITIIAKTPQELFIKEKLAETVFIESPINPPTTGMKFPIANLTVRRDNESALWLKTL